MLMREPTITNKKGSEKGRTICKISPFTDPFYYYPPSNRSAQPPLLDTPESRTLSEHSRPPQRRTAAWPGGEEREKGRRPSQLRVFPLLANYRLPKGRTFIPKIKNYKKRDRQTNKVQQSQKKKKTLFILTLSYLFLTFSSISSALSISLFSSFGRTILRIIANTAAGTIPEPPKIRLIACGRCTRIAVLEPSP